MRPAILLTALLLGAAAVSAADPARKLAQSVQPSVVHGKDSDRVGWYVSLGYLERNGEWRSRCGGMMITQTHVLTAAHCVFEGDGVLSPPNTVAIGIHNRVTDSPGVDYEVADVNVTRTVVHPRYVYGPGGVFNGEGFDIAILELDPSTVSGQNELVALPTFVPKPRNPVPTGTRLALVGLGDLAGNRTYPTTLQRTDLVLEPLETCNEAYATWSYVPDFFESTGICAGAPRTNKFTDACKGDSGGPLFAPSTAGRPYDTAIGLVSYGDDCSVLSKKTRYGTPGVYTNIAQLKRWIKANLACLETGEPCPWGGTCFDYAANGCATCQVGNPTACGNCTVPGYVPDKDGKCRPADCRDVIDGCIECARPRRRGHGHRQPECAACAFGLKLVNNECVPKTCLDYGRGCGQCDPANPIMCVACKRHHVLDTNIGKCVRLHH